MKYTVIALVMFLAAVVYGANTKPAPFTNSAKVSFERFKTRFGRLYGNEAEEQARFVIFRDNLAYVNQLNAKDENKPYGVTKFMDLSRTEFAAQYLMKGVNLTKDARAGEKAAPITNPVQLPTTFDWKSQTPNCVSDVKDQGQCGSCWAFSAVETIESVCCQAGFAKTILSEQQIVDCDTDGGVQGCNGGWPEDVYTYAQTFGGLDTEAAYPYTAQDGTCQASNTGKYSCPITSWKFVSQDASTENVMQQYLYSNSPMSIACDAETWQFYTTGVVSASSCGQDLDHAIQVTGWTVMNGQAAWTVRNSWNTDWGMDGYIYLQLGANTCGIATHVTVPCVKSASGATVC